MICIGDGYVDVGRVAPRPPTKRSATKVVTAPIKLSGSSGLRKDNVFHLRIEEITRSICEILLREAILNLLILNKTFYCVLFLYINFVWNETKWT